MSAILETMCSFGIHAWVLDHEGRRYMFYKCKRCGQEEIRDK